MIKVTTKNNKTKMRIEFPALFQSVRDRDLIVLFTQKQSGVVISPSQHWPNIGDTHDCWISCDDSDSWQSYNGTIELSNTQ